MLGTEKFQNIARFKVFRLEFLLFFFFALDEKTLLSFETVPNHSYQDSGIHSFISIQPLGQFSRNQNPVMRPVWLWHTASWAIS